MGQQYHFIEYNPTDGLAQSQIRSITSDSQGKLWIGTLGGISNFDGKNFSNFSKFNGLMDDHANVIIELKNGSMAIGFLGGISLIDATGIINYQFEPEYKNTFVSDLIELEDEILISTFEGIFVLKEGLISPIKTSQKDKSHDIFRNYKDEILIGFGSKILQYDNGTLTELHHLPGDDLTVMSINEDTDQSLLIGTNNKGLFSISTDNKIENINTSDGLISQEIKSILRPNENEIWLGTPDGISILSSEGIQNLNEGNGLPSNDIECMSTDFNGHIWIGTNVAGLAKYTSREIINFTTIDGLSSDLIMSIEEENGSMIIGTYDEGYNTIRHKKISTSTLDNSSRGKRIWDIHKTDRGQTFFATENGLYIQDEYGDKRLLNEEDGLASDRIKCVYQDSKKRIWIGNNGGVNFIENDSLYQFDFPAEYKISKTRSIIEDQNGVFWFGTRQGLVKYSNNEFKLFDIDDGFMDVSIYDLEVDKNNRLWVGTRFGLHLIESDKVSFIQLADDSPSNHVNFVKEYNHEVHVLIIGTNSSIYILDLDKNNFAPNSAVHISEPQGLIGTETNQNAIFVDSENQVWMGSTQGLNLIKNLEDLLEFEKETPKIILENIRLNLENVDWSDYTPNLDRSTGLPESVEVDHRQNHFTFDFQGISYNNPDDLVYQYYLEGYDAGWRPLTQDEIATYSNLPYDSFTFWVRCKIKNSGWSEHLSFDLTILPPFWRTWWFYILCVLAFFGIIAGISNRRKKILMTELEKEKFEFKSKMLVLEQQSLNSSMNRHFIFNSLNSIQYYINRKDRLAANKYLSSFAKLIRKNLDSSQSNTTKLSEELDRLKLYVELEQMRFQDKFDFHLNLGPDIIPEDVNVPSMLLQPFLENSIWHGLLPKGEKGEITIDIEREKSNLVIIIKDNGIGIETSLNNKNGQINHDSKGVNITKGRIDLIKKAAQSSMELIGPQELKNNNNETIGTEVRIIIPDNLKEFYVK